MKTYEAFYSDGAFYGRMSFKNKTQGEIERIIKDEIAENNKNVNPLYHLTRSDFREVVQ